MANDPTPRRTSGDTTPKALETRVVSQAIDAGADAVYAYARTMETLPEWASGLASGIRQEGGAWFSDSPMGRVRIDMAPQNEFGVLDHDVTLPDGSVVHNAMRVVPSGEGSFVTFVLCRLPGVSAADFQKDAEHVTKDLAALKARVEGSPG